MTFSMGGIGSDWANFINAASVNGLWMKNLCIDINGPVVVASAKIEGSHIWAYCQSWLFDCKGQGSFVLKMDNTQKALKMIGQKKYWTAQEEKEGTLIFRSDEGDSIDLELLDYDDHIDMRNLQTSYVEPKAELDNHRWICAIVSQETGLPIPVPALKPHRNPYIPWDQKITVSREEWLTQLKAAKDIECDEVVLSTIKNENKLTFFLQAGKQIGKTSGKVKLSGHGKVPAKSINGMMDWTHSYERDHLEKVVANCNQDELYVAMASHEDQSMLWLGSHIKGAIEPTPENPAITMACYYIGDLDSRS